MLRRLGKSPDELGNTDKISGCPDMWELDNGDIAVIGRDLTAAYAARLPETAAIAEDAITPTVAAVQSCTLRG